MSRILSRPMFRRGGSTGGITSGLGRQGYNLGQRVTKDALSIYDSMDEAARQRGLYQTSGRRNLNDFLINFGLNMVGNAPTGNIFQTAATAAQKPFQQFQSTRASEEAEQRRLGQAILGDAFEMSAALEEAKLEGTGGGKKAYQLEILDILENKKAENNRLQGQNKQLDLEIGTLDPTREQDAVRIKEIKDIQSKNNDRISINADIMTKIEGPDELYKQKFIAMSETYGLEDPEFQEFLKTGKLPGEMKTGGRVGYQQGSVVQEQITETVGPATTPTSQVQQLDFTTLRARLPNEITDDIVKLLADSEEALTAFANIRTQEDGDQFNQTSNVSLVLPQEA